MTSVIVTLDDAARSHLGRVTEALRDRGLRVDRVLDEIGVIAGQLPAGRSLATLRVDGVVAVEEARPVRLPPPDAPVQ